MGILAVRAPRGWLGPGPVVEDVLVVVRGAGVEYAGPRAEFTGEYEPEDVVRIEGFLMPGVVDRHVHIGLADAAAVVRGGVTAVRDLGWSPDRIWAAAEESEGPFDGPLIRGVGPIVTCPGGYPSRAAWAPRGTAMEVRGADEAADAVRSILARSGVAAVKIALNADAGPTLSDDELVAICDAAREAGALVTAHVQGEGQTARAVGAGVAELAHTPWTERLPDDLLAAMAGRVRIVSTLDIHSGGKETPELHAALDNLSRFLAVGGGVAYGTDLGNGEIPPGIHVGEIWHLHRAGLTPEQLLETITFRPLAEGELADLVVLGGNPLEDLNAYGSVRYVLRAGRRMR
ncbi:MAG TPA: amidohydrolase family protein [Actinomycetota bacterium]|nr:amidohydrolase family protein [Actinomycetota bacterium]